MVTKKYLLWLELNYIWSDISRNGDLMIWSDISIIEEVKKILKGGGNWSPLKRELENGNPWKKISDTIGDDRSERFIKIFCTINEIEYEMGKFKKNNIKVSVSNFEKVFNEKIDIKVKILK